MAHTPSLASKTIAATHIRGFYRAGSSRADLPKLICTLAGEVKEK